MKVGLVVIVGTVVSLAFSQAQIRTNQARVDYIHFLGEQKPDRTTLQDLMDAIDDRDPDVRMEALQVWQKAGHEYFRLDLFKSNTGSDINFQYSERQNWLRQLLVKIEPKSSDSPLVTKQALRTLCSLGRTAVSICPPYPTCGMSRGKPFGTEVLTQLAKDHATTFVELLDDKDPNVVLNAWQVLDADHRKNLLPKAISFVRGSDDLFKAIGAAMISMNWREKGVELLSPLLDDPEYKVRSTASLHVIVSMSDQQAIDISTNKACSIKLRELAIRSLGSVRNERNNKLVRQLIDAPEPEIRAEAIYMYFLDREKRDPDL
ncbi:MAG: HEAT repeat domain-containing protein [Armatimonadota bacterium]